MLHLLDVPTQEELLSPYMLGMLDAQEGKLCISEVYYVRRMEQCDYCRGYAHIASDTLTTRHFLSDAEVRAELNDYLDYLEDVEWMRAQGAPGC